MWPRRKIQMPLSGVSLFCAVRPSKGKSRAASQHSLCTGKVYFRSCRSKRAVFSFVAISKFVPLCSIFYYTGEHEVHTIRGATKLRQSSRYLNVARNDAITDGELDTC